MDTVKVDLRDPAPVAFEAALTVLALVWLHVEARDYRFVSGLSKSISRARAFEKEIEQEISGKTSDA